MSTTVQHREENPVRRDDDGDRESRRLRWTALHSLCTSSGISVNEWAKRSGRPQQTLASYVAGDAVPSEDALADLCVGLGLPKRAKDLLYLDRLADIARRRAFAARMIELMQEQLNRAANLTEVGAAVVGDDEQRGRAIEGVYRVFGPAETLLRTILLELSDPDVLDASIPESPELRRLRKRLTQFRADVLALWRAIDAANMPGLNEMQRFGQVAHAIVRSIDTVRGLFGREAQAAELITVVSPFFQSLGSPPRDSESATGGDAAH